MGSGVEPQSLHPYEDVWGCRAPCLLWLLMMFRAELPKAGPLGMVGAEVTVAGSYQGWPKVASL